MSWLFSQALVEAYSEENSSDGVPSAPLSVMPTRHKFWHNDKMTEPSNLSRYGLTCRVLTESRVEELLMLYLADFRARTSALLEKDADWTEHGRGFGEKWRGSSAKYDPNTFSWKIRRFSLLGEEIELLETLPRWGMTLNGELSERTMPTLHTSATASGSSRSVSGKSTKTSELSESLFDEIESNEDRSSQEFFYTPKANDAEKRGKVSADKRNGIVGQVMNFPTPQATDYKTKKTSANWKAKGRVNFSLANPEVMYFYPTPNASDGYKWNNMTAEERMAKGQFIRLGNYVSSIEGIRCGGLLNPNWEEWLMGWPIGHTALKPLETDKLAEWYRWHGVS